MPRFKDLGMMPPDHPLFQQGLSLVGVKLSSPSTMHPSDNYSEDPMAEAQDLYEQGLEQLLALHCQSTIKQSGEEQERNR